MKELIERGYAIKRDREILRPERGYLGETHAQVRDLDVSCVQRPVTLYVSPGAASTHGLTPVTQDPVTAAGRNNNTSVTVTIASFLTDIDATAVTCGTYTLRS